MTPYQSMVKKIISTIEIMQAVELELSSFRIELDGDSHGCINQISEVIYDLDEMLEENESCEELLLEIAEIWESMSESDGGEPFAITELEYALHDLGELENKTGPLLISHYLEKYKDALAAIEGSLAFFHESVSDRIDE
jgi:hypothetical protein